MSLDPVNSLYGQSLNYSDHEEKELGKALRLFQTMLQKGEFPQGAKNIQRRGQRGKRKRSLSEQSVTVVVPNKEKVRPEGATERYEGDIKDGQRSGKGKLTIQYPKGPVKVKVYIGQFAEGLPSGKGALFTMLSDGTMKNEAGEWLKGRRIK